MLKGGVIMDVTDDKQAKIAEDAGACAVMALERVPSDIREDGGVARMSDPSMIEKIMKTVSIPVMAKCRIGHFAEAQVLQSLGVDYIDESEVLTPGRRRVPRRQVRVHRAVRLRLPESGRGAAAHRRRRRDDPHEGRGRHREHRRGGAPHARGGLGDEAPDPARPRRDDDRGQEPRRAVRAGAPGGGASGKLPVPNFAAGGIATPADASLMMQLGAEAVFVGSGIFKSEDPAVRAKAIVRATTHYKDPKVVAEVSRAWARRCTGSRRSKLAESELLQTRGW